MNKPDYTEFDTALLAQIAAGRNTMMQLDGEASGLRAVAAPFCTSMTPTFRIIDRRLQALRKRGELRFNGKVWVRIGKNGQPL